MVTRGAHWAALAFALCAGACVKSERPTASAGDDLDPATREETLAKLAAAKLVCEGSAQGSSVTLWMDGEKLLNAPWAGMGGKMLPGDVVVDLNFVGKFPDRKCVVTVDGQPRYEQAVAPPTGYFPCAEGGSSYALDHATIARLSPLRAAPVATGWDLTFNGKVVTHVPNNNFDTRVFRYDGPIGEWSDATIQCTARQVRYQRETGLLPRSVFSMVMSCDAWAPVSEDPKVSLPIGCVVGDDEMTFEAYRPPSPEGEFCENILDCP